MPNGWGAMQLDKPTLGEVVDGAKTRYEIPLYQRTYDWGPKQFEQLWADIESLAISRRTDLNREHFLGTLVLDTAHQTPNNNTFLVVDGQQRLTTLILLLTALRDAYSESGSDKSEEIQEDRLIHRKKISGPERYRLWPTQGDRATFKEIIERNIDRSRKSNLIATYDYFYKAIHKSSLASGVALDEIYDAVLGGLRFVSITAENQDNVYAIFESLNNTGLKLTQGDLLRNFYFSRLGDLAESSYESFWYPMQERLSRADLAHLFWIDMTWSDTEIKKDDTFKEQSARVNNFNPEELRDEIKRFNALSVLLEVMRSPIKVDDLDLRRSLQRLVDFGIESTDPLVLGLMSLRQRKTITSQQTVDALAIIESFLVRRLIVRAPHNALSRILMRAFDAIDHADPAGSLRAYFTRDNKDYATDDQIREAVLSVNFYRSGSRKQQKTLLTWLEDALAGNEPANLSKATVEHVLPQKLTEHWREELRADLGDFDSPEAVHETLVHTLANLTLSGYNSKLSNKPFAEKRKLLIDKSNIELNKWISRHNSWRRTEIMDRAELLSTQIISAWPGPLNDSETSSYSRVQESSDVNDVLESIPTGKWISYGDLAELTRLSVAAVKRVFKDSNLKYSWRVMEADGQYPSDSELPADRNKLELDGVQFDSLGSAMQQHRWDFEGSRSNSPDGDGAGNVELTSGPLKEFLDEAANRLAPALSENLRNSVIAQLSRGDHILLSVDPDDSGVLTATFQGKDEDAVRAEVRVTPTNGLWLRRSGKTDFELVESQTPMPLLPYAQAD